jgi:hypothetical protein
MVAGSGKVRVATRSKGRAGSIASSRSLTVARMVSCIEATRRGVKARAVWRRTRVCSGGSRLTIDGAGRWPPPSSSSPASWLNAASGSCAAAAENVSWSRKIASMSSWRVTT